MREWRDLHTQLIHACRELGLKMNRNAADERDIHRALLAGYVTQVAERSSEGTISAPQSKVHDISRIYALQAQTSVDHGGLAG